MLYDIKILDCDCAKIRLTMRSRASTSKAMDEIYVNDPSVPIADFATA